MGNTDGALWGHRLQHADAGRTPWRTIVWQVRDHYDGCTPSGLEAPVPFNLHRAVEDGMIAALRPRMLKYRLEADRFEEQEDADAAESYANWCTRATRFVAETHDFITAERTDGLAIYKVEYGSVFTPRVDPATGRAIPGAPDDRERADRSAEQRDALRQAAPHELEGVEASQARLIDTMDFLKSPEEPTLAGSAWAGHGVWMRPQAVRDLQASGYFRPGKLRYFSRMLPSTAERMDRQTARRTFWPSAAGAPGGKVEEDLDEWWQVWEIYDFRTHRIITVLPGTDFVLRAFAVPDELRGCPYVVGSPTRNGRTFWTLPYAHHYLPAQDVLDRVVSDTVESYAKFRKKLLLTNGGKVDEAEKQAIAKAVNGELVSLKDLDPETIKEFDMGGMSADSLKMMTMLQGILHRVAGQPELTVGGSTGDTATEFKGIQDFFLTRVGAMEEDLNDVFAQVAERFVRLAAALAPPEVVVPVIGAAQGQAWSRLQERFRVVRRTQLARPFTYHVEVGAGAARMNQLRLAQLLNLWNHLQPVLPPPAQLALARKILQAADLNPDEILGSATSLGAMMEAALGGAAGAGTTIQQGRGAQGGAPTGPPPPSGPMQSRDAATRGGRMPQMGPALTEAARNGGPRKSRAA